MCGTDCFLMLLSVLFPPIGVWVKRGICSADSLINLALCCLGVLPGLLHAWYIILKYPDTYEYDRMQDGERQSDGTVTYYYIARGGPPRGQHQNMNYGTVGVAGSQPSGGQFPGQQSGVTNQHPAAPKANAQKKVGAQAAAEQTHEDAGPVQDGGEGSAQPHGSPPTYADVIKGDHKVQKQ